MKKVFQNIVYKFFQIENLYMKFILTVIAVSLIAISIELSDRNYYSTVDIIHGFVKIDGAVDISGEVNTYEQNMIIGRKFNQ